MAFAVLFGALNMLIWFIVFFIVSQIVVEKDWLPKRIVEIGLFHSCILAMFSILSSILIGILLTLPLFIVGSTTIFFSVLISWKYRNKYDKMESGEK